ncbi:MAG: chemotaxis protein CheD [Candidatus Bathyarchaeia archaeon]
MVSSLEGCCNNKLTINVPNRNKPAFAYEQLEPASCITIEANTAPKVEEVRVDMADMKVESGSVELLTSVGSCVAICVHDPLHKCGGLAHVMLPYSGDMANEPLPSKYADTAIPALVNGIRKKNEKESCLFAKIAGGANMFANLNSEYLDIGGKNVRAVKTVLSKYNVRLRGEDVGGSHGRRISFDVRSGVVTIKCFNGETRKL